MIIRKGAIRLDRNKKRNIKKNLLNFAAFVFFIIALVLIVILILSGNDRVQFWWQTYQEYLVAAQHRVENLQDKGYIIFTLMFLFAFKSFIPIYPISIICTVTGVVFPSYIAIPVNIIGMALHFTLKYMWGMRIGPGGVNIILKRNEAIRVFMKKDGTGNPWMLVLFRLIPCFPINPVSQIYGSMGFRFTKFLALSLLGYLPLLCSYTIVGRNVYNPLSAGFLLPLIVLSLLAATVCYVLSVLLYYSKKRRRNKNVRNSNLERTAQ